MAALAACETYLARRPGDSSLLAAKAIVRNEMGDEAAVRQIIDYQRLVRSVRLTTPPGYQSLAAFNCAVAEHVRSHPSLRFTPSGHATRHAHQSGSLLVEPKGPIADLERAIWEALAEHERLIAQSDPRHPFLLARPSSIGMIMWGVVMHAGGHQTSHIHPASWVSGVYYPRVPASVSPAADSQAGWIEFARTPDWFHHRREMAAASISTRGGRSIALSRLPVASHLATGGGAGANQHRIRHRAVRRLRKGLNKCILHFSDAQSENAVIALLTFSVACSH